VKHSPSSRCHEIVRGGGGIVVVALSARRRRRPLRRRRRRRWRRLRSVEQHTRPW